MASHSSASSSRYSSSRPDSLRHQPNPAPSPSPGPSPDADPVHDGDVPVEVLVEHLLAAKRSLSSIHTVLRANDLATHGRQLHEQSVILSAQTAFLRNGIGEQARLLRQVRKGMGKVYDAGKSDFKRLIRQLDHADGQLKKTMSMLSNTGVESVFRPKGEEQKSLMDFVDEKSVDEMRDALKSSLGELRGAQTSFDGDLLRFDNDLRSLAKTMASSPAPPSPSSSSPYQPIPHLLILLTSHAQGMAEHLTSLTMHFDKCVRAVRTTEGGAALARRKAAEATQSQGAGDPVSISGVLAKQEAEIAELEPMSAEEHADLVRVVIEDAAEVDEVVAELEAVLHRMESDFSALKEQADQIQRTYLATVAACHVLEEVGSRLHSYVAAESEYIQRWENEKDIIFGKLGEMEELRHFYEGYANAYDGLVLEVERRRAVEDKIQNTWRKAREAVEKLVEADRKQREGFRQEVGEFVPTDLWVDMNAPLRRWEVVPVDDAGEGSTQTQLRRSEGSSSTLGPASVEAAKDRRPRGHSGR
ncbi:kinase activator [Thozetella sp. PMI_491]|nr:kinase activator [Thozetella sp. PMI_491]